MSENGGFSHPVMPIWMGTMMIRWNDGTLFEDGRIEGTEQSKPFGKIVNWEKTDQLDTLVKL